MALYKGANKVAGSAGDGFSPENAGTTGQVLKKTAAGYNWDDESGAVTSVNGQTGAVTVNPGITKIFTLPSDVTTAEALAVAQEAYDWYVAGNNPVIYRVNSQRYFSIGRIQSTRITFYQTQTIFSNDNYAGYSNISQDSIAFTLSSGTVTEITTSTSFKSVLSAGVDYTTPYTPEYDGSPATKKYVDDNKGTKVELVTQAQYNNIGSEKLTNGVLYGIIEN